MERHQTYGFHPQLGTALGKLFTPMCSHHQNPPHHLLKLGFVSEILHFTMQINAYQEGTKINAEVNERPLKTIGMHWNITNIILNEYQFPSA